MLEGVLLCPSGLSVYSTDKKGTDHEASHDRALGSAGSGGAVLDARLRPGNRFGQAVPGHAGLFAARPRPAVDLRRKGRLAADEVHLRS